jgi:hypothetical protein
MTRAHGALVGEPRLVDPVEPPEQAAIRLVSFRGSCEDTLLSTRRAI